METLTAVEPACRSDRNDPTGRGPHAWAFDLVGDCFAEELSRSSGIVVQRYIGPDFTLVSSVVPGARSLDSTDFRLSVEGLYDDLLGAVADRGIVRFWNFIPGILDPVDGFDQRYKVFNAGRFNTFRRWYGDSGGFGSRIATASGVGAAGDDFVVHALATSNPAQPVENPRQIPSYRYSKRFGPLPPCFSRAIRVGGRTERLLVGGTASIRQEDTVHLNDLDAQFDETIGNLAALVAAGEGIDDWRGLTRDETRSLLKRFKEIRVYCPDSENLNVLAPRLRLTFPGVSNMELLQADLCRPGLMVEIEGLAALSRRT